MKINHISFKEHWNSVLLALSDKPQTAKEIAIKLGRSVPSVSNTLVIANKLLWVHVAGQRIDKNYRRNPLYVLHDSDNVEST